MKKFNCINTVHVQLINFCLGLIKAPYFFPILNRFKRILNFYFVKDIHVHISTFHLLILVLHVIEHLLIEQKQL